MSRSEAREHAFLLLYQMEFQSRADEEQIDLFLEQYQVALADQAYIKALVRGVRSRQNELDERFEPYLKRWSKERLPKVDLIILRLAIFEMYHEEDVPENVAISEAVLLCHRYTSDESRSYINAVLGRISNTMGGEQA